MATTNRIKFFDDSNNILVLIISEMKIGSDNGRKKIIQTLEQRI
jgi:hypothetical protein